MSRHSDLLRRLRFSGFLAWLAIHIDVLIGFRDRIAVMLGRTHS